MDPDDDPFWQELHAADTAYFQARITFLARSPDVEGVLRRALASHQRGTALRVLRGFDDARLRPFLPTLASLASLGHSDIALVRAVILRMDRDWLTESIDAHVCENLDGEADEEEYRRFAELYCILDADLLRLHLDRCRGHANPEIKEIADDFEPYLESGPPAFLTDFP